MNRGELKNEDPDITPATQMVGKSKVTSISLVTLSHHLLDKSFVGAHLSMNSYLFNHMQTNGPLVYQQISNSVDL